jgi:hypothetical protein
MEYELPRWVKSRMDAADANRLKLRKLTLLPSSHCPRIDAELDIRMKLRKLTLEPNCKYSRILIAEPTRANDRTLTVLPKCAKVKMLKFVFRRILPWIDAWAPTRK